MENTTEIKLRPYQDQFIFDDSYKYKFMKAGWATGKSLSLILACVRQCELYPDNLGVIYRKEAVDLRDSTIKQFEQLTGMVVDSKRDVTFPNKSVLMFRHKEDVFGTVQNMNLGFAGIEEHAELDNDDLFYLLFGRLRRANSGLKLFSVGNANGRNWVYKIRQSGIFDPQDNKKRLDLHISATTHDNSINLSPEFISSLEILKEKKPEFYNRFVLNSDEDNEITDLIINPKWIIPSIGKELFMVPPFKRIVSIDVARYGDDKTVFYALEGDKNGRIRTMAKETWEKKSTMETVGLALKFAKKNMEISSFAVDEIGVGGGVADRLEELEQIVLKVNSARKSDRPENFYNLRAEIYQTGSDLFENGFASLLKDDIELQEELGWAKYKQIKSNGVFQVEAKDDIKKRYGKSPDNADAFLQGVWAMPRIEVKNKMDKYYRDNREFRLNPMTV